MEEPPRQPIKAALRSQGNHSDALSAITTLPEDHHVQHSSLPTSPTSDLSGDLDPDSQDPTSDQGPNAPLFWTTRHGRSVSTISHHSLGETPPPAINLEDHSSEDDLATHGCWAAGVTVDSYTIIEGSGSPHYSNMAAYVIWHINVRTLKGGAIRLNKRYSEIDKLRIDLVKSFPHAEGMLPKLPRKGLVSRFRPKFLEQRRVGLGHFLNCVLLNMEFAASPMVKEFIFA